MLRVLAATLLISFVVIAFVDQRRPRSEIDAGSVNALSVATRASVDQPHPSSSRSEHTSVRATAPAITVDDEADKTDQQNPAPPAAIPAPVITSPPGAEKVEQKSQGEKPAAEL